MKFHEVQIGHVFEYRKARYEKISIVIARNLDDGANKFFKRSDNVDIHITAPAAAPKPPTNDALAAIEAYHVKCGEILQQSGLPPETISQIIGQFEQAKSLISKHFGTK